MSDNPNNFSSPLVAAICGYPLSERQKQIYADNERFLTEWGTQAYALGWTVRELFGPAGLTSRLEGRPVIALTAAQAVIQDGNQRTLYRRPRRLSNDKATLDEALGKILPFVAGKPVAGG